MASEPGGHSNYSRTAPMPSLAAIALNIHKITSMRFIIISILFLTYPLYNFGQNHWAYVSLDSGKNKKLGILSETGKLIVPMKYDFIGSGTGFYFVKQKQMWGCYNKIGENIIPLEYEDIGFQISNNLVRVKKNGKWGFVDLQNNIKIQFQFDFLCNFDDGKAYAKKDGKKYYINTQGGIITETNKDENFCSEDGRPVADINNQFNDSILIIERKEKYGVVESKTNKVIIPFKYDEIGLYYNNIILVRSKDKWGAYTDSGRLISEPKYSYLEIFWAD